jgi:hypothetical protein
MGVMEVQIYTFFTLAHTAQFTYVERAYSNNRIWGWVGPRATLYIVITLSVWWPFKLQIPRASSF